METVVVNKLNAYLKLLDITNIKFKLTYSFINKYSIAILLPLMKTRDFSIFARFYDSDDVFKHGTQVYNEIIYKRKRCLADDSKKSDYYFAYHTLTSVEIQFLEILSTCNSLEELELKLSIHGFKL